MNKSSLKTANHHREGIYTTFKLQLSALTEVVQWIETFIFSSNVSGGSGFESPESNFSGPYLLFIFFLFYSPFYRCGAYS